MAGSVSPRINAWPPRERGAHNDIARIHAVNVSNRASTPNAYKLVQASSTATARYSWPADPCSALTGRTRFETGSGDDNHRLASYIAHQTLRLAGQNYWHATEQSSQLRRSAGSPHTHHAHTFMPTARALPVDGGSPTPAASRCRIPAVGRQLQRSGTLGTTHLTMAFRTAQGLTDIVLRNG